MSAIVTLRPTTAPTHLPICHGRTTTIPHPQAMLAWSFVEAAFTSAWELPADRGLAIAFWPRTRKGALAWDLGITHAATGRGLGLTRQGGAAIELTPANLRKLRAAVADLLALGVDWTDHDFSAHPDLGQRVRAVYNRHFPAIPEFRAWRLGSDDKPECKWFKSNAAAMSWAERCERWWLIERWTIPPTRAHAQGLLTFQRCPDFDAVTRGELPDGCAFVRWQAWGAVREATPGQPAPPVDLSKHCAAPLVANAYIDERDLDRAPTGEINPGIERLVHDGLLARVSHECGSRGPRCWLEPTRLGLLAMSREARSRGDQAWQHQTTTEALERWRDARKADRREGRAWDLWGSASRRARLEAWLHLLRCVARDVAATATGQPRFEIGDDHDADSSELHEFTGGVCLAKITRRSAWRWLVFRALPVVPWAPSAALAIDRGPPDAYGYRERTRQEFDYRENAERYAQELRTT
jgi:hypothetical protein